MLDHFYVIGNKYLKYQSTISSFYANPLTKYFKIAEARLLSDSQSKVAER